MTYGATGGGYAIRIFYFLFFFLLPGCSLGEMLEEAPLPPPVATAQPWSLDQAPVGDLILDPVSNVVPAVDPDIASLVSSVSQQQLMGYVQAVESFGTRNTFSVTDNPTFGIGAARQWIFNEFQRVGNGRLQVQFQRFPVYYFGYTAEAWNVVATLPGTSGSNDAIVIMAHYDTRPDDATDGASLAPGANDNGGGIALLLETARLMSSREWNQTIVFLAAAAEEQDAQGARRFVQEFFLSGMDVTAAINYDGVGGEVGIPQNIRLFALDMRQSPHGELARYYEYVGGLYVPAFPIHLIDALDREGRYGDHREFVNAGMPAIRLTQSIENPDLLNSRGDTWTQIDYRYLQQVVQMNVAVVANLAGSPATPEVPLIRAMDEPGQYRLNWPVDPAAAGYVIAFRPMAQERYPSFRYVRAREAGNIALTGFDSGMTYAVSMAALDGYGRVSHFTREVIVEPVRETASSP
ncbi:MAG: M20/M25/M40 family metallo-hydrolase [Anaerolineae bacterium]|nr:M20/M25/M40 family metallo-hydrolase [Anaerolineae bacterium]